MFFMPFLLLFFGACKLEQYKEPKSTNEEFNFASAITIADLRSSMGFSGAKEIKDNVVIAGYVIANDRTNNLFKQVIIDDGTAAIPILLDAFNLYNDFPIGRRVYVRCKGLYTNFYYKLPQLCFMPDEQGASIPIPFYLWSNFLAVSTESITIKPIEISLKDSMLAQPNLFNRLVHIIDAQIADTLLSNQYALDADLNSATNIQLMDCDSNMISIRTSGFASFRKAIPPKGRGSITAIYSVFNNTAQLLLRDTVDINFSRPRCL
jgi:hypothetical protein